VKKFFSCLAIVVPAVAVVVPQVAVAAPPANSNNVTICHRTHSVTNPYVRITVDQRSVGNANSKHGGGAHDYWASSLYASKPNPNVFNPAKTYPANDKKWGDIIAFTDVSGNALTGSALNVAGLNNTGIGAQIYAGTGSYAGLCRTMNARDYYEVELAAGVPPADILADMNELDSPDFASTLSACGGTFTGCNPTILGTTSITIVTTTTSSVAPTTTVRGATTTTVAATRKLKGTLWIDANRDGKKDATEKVLANYTVTVKSGTGNSSTQTYTVTTDSAGNYEVANIPAGNWIVTPAALPSANYEKVFDTDSNTTSADWVVTASVPTTGTATADFATALTAAAVAAGATDTLGAVAVTTTTVKLASATGTAGSGSVTVGSPLPTTGMGSTGLLVLLATLSGIIGAALLQVRRRRLEA
jgi:SdrD B-like domain